MSNKKTNKTKNIKKCKKYTKKSLKKFNNITKTTCSIKRKTKTLIKINNKSKTNRKMKKLKKLQKLNKSKKSVNININNQKTLITKSPKITNINIVDKSKIKTNNLTKGETNNIDNNIEKQKTDNIQNQLQKTNKSNQEQPIKEKVQNIKTQNYKQLKRKSVFFNNQEPLVPRELLGDLPSKWSKVISLEDAKQLVNYGVILNLTGIQRLQRMLTQTQIKELLQYYGFKFAEQNNKLHETIILQSVILWLYHTKKEEHMYYFLEAIIDHPNCINAIYKLVERALTIDITAIDVNEDPYYDIYISIAVALISELGLALNKIYQEDPNSLPNLQNIIEYISTYLLSLSNSENNFVRLRLLNYFAIIDSGKANKNGLNKLMSRFGHSMLDKIFSIIFDNKTPQQHKNVAFQFININLPYLLEVDYYGQKIIHEVFKYYLFKKPKMFATFILQFSRAFYHSIKIYSKYYSKSNIQLKNFLQQIGALLHIADMLHNETLSKIFIHIFDMYKNFPDTTLIIKEILNNNLIKSNDLIIMLKYILQTTKDAACLFRNTYVNKLAETNKYKTHKKHINMQKIIYLLEKAIINIKTEPDQHTLKKLHLKAS